MCTCTYTYSTAYSKHIRNIYATKRRAGKGQKKLTPFTTLYALVQCTRDMSPFSCTQCLAVVESNFPPYCDGKKGCRIFFCNCFARYKLYPFFYPLPSSPKFSSNAMQVHSSIELASKAPSKGFLATSYGSSKYIVYGLAQCRGDVVGMADCSTSIQDAAKLILTSTVCPRENDARIWFDLCFLRYGYDDNFIGKVDTSIDIHYNNVDDVIDTEQFIKELAKLMKKIRLEALKPENAGLGKGQKKLTLFITLYTLVQCTQDLSPISCAQCLGIAETNFVTYCANKRGCRIFYSSCFALYEFYPFFYPLSSAPELSNNTQKVVVHP